MFEDIYKKIVNKPLMLVFDQYFNIQFYVKLNKDNSVVISDSFIKDYDKIYIKCRKLSTQNWEIISQQQNSQIREKLLLMFSLFQTNFLPIEFDQNNFVKLQTINKFLSINFKIIKKIIYKINQFYDDKRDSKYQSNLTLQFRRLYNSEKGIILRYKQISQYLHYCNFWQKLGLNYFQVKQLPHDVYRNFVMMMNIETQVKNAEIQKANKKLNSRR